MTTFDAEETQQRLGRIGHSIRVADVMMVLVTARRMQLADQVAWTKFHRRDDEYPNGEPISRPEVETQRLDAIAAVAPQYGLDPELARSVLKFLIDHSCKLQMMRWQSGQHGYDEPDEAQMILNLEQLTAHVSAGSGSHDQHFPATRLYREFELEQIYNQVSRLSRAGRCLDLGCGLGPVSLMMTEHFDEVIGVDISPDMIQAARVMTAQNLSYVVADVAQETFWSTQQDESCDFVVMGLGVASTISRIEFVISEIDRVLAPGGRFVLSFYNSEALVHQPGYQLPWLPSMAAVLDAPRSSLNVSAGDRLVSVYAKPYDLDAINDLVTRHLQVMDFVTFPTLAPTLPAVMLEDEATREVVVRFDRQQAEAGGSDGAYVIAAGRK